MHTCNTCQHPAPIQLFSGLTEDGEGLVAMDVEDEETGEVSSIVFTLAEMRDLVNVINDAITKTEQRVLNAMTLA